ncbi:MAG: hypothetical protein RLZZ383_1244 [Pseudomonadota bacterium]|jgi:F-type H+-transporting ATPase subunit epsilon
MASMHVDIVTPEKTVFSGPADEVVVPSVLGQVGVRPDHAQVLALLAGGLTSVLGKDAKRFVTGRGFVEVNAERVTVLTESCRVVDAKAPTDAEARAMLASAEKAMADTLADTAERRQAEADAELARAWLAAR